MGLIILTLLGLKYLPGWVKISVAFPRPVGDKSDRSFNVRIIAATNEDLEKAVNEKRFRQDLLYRLHDFEITVLPLRDCQEEHHAAGGVLP